MHPDLFLRVYRQQERQLEELLRHRLASQERATAPAPEVPRARPSGPVRLLRRLEGLGRPQVAAAEGVCCAV